jgi:hypothetical protein
MGSSPILPIPPGSGPSNQSSSRFQQFIQWTGVPTVVGALVERLTTRVRKTQAKAEFQWRKIARFTTWHTGLQPVEFVVKFQTRVRKKLKTYRKYAHFSQWHTGLQIDNPFTVALRTRVRKTLAKASFQFRKRAIFKLFNTGLQPRIAQWQHRVRSFSKKSSFQFRKLARFAIWHTGQTGVPGVQTFHFKARKWSFRRSKQHFAKWFTPVFHTGFQPSVNVVQFQARRPKTLKHQNKQYRHALFTQFHTGATSVNEAFTHWSGHRWKFRRRQAVRAHFVTMFHVIQPISIPGGISWINPAIHRIGIGGGNN